MRRSYAQARASAGDPATEGSWGAPFVMTSNYEGYGIHAALLRTGKVLMWGYPMHPATTGYRGNQSYAWLWDPSLGTGANSIKKVEPIGADGKNVSIYCSGMSFLPDGRVLVVGGNLAWPDDDPNDEYTEFVGLDRALLFDPSSETWTELPRPPLAPGVFNGRWYPTQVLLPDGRTLVVSGLTDEPPGGDTNDMHEIYEPPSGSHPLGQFSLLDGPTQVRETELYPHLFVMPDGQVLLAGPNPDDTARFDPGDLADPWTDLPDLASQRIGGTAVLLPGTENGSWRVAAIGGRPYDPEPPEPPAVPAPGNEQIDLSDQSPTWSPFPANITARSYPNTVLLPDRSMVTIGGDSRVVEQDAEGEAVWPPPERHVELYDPVTQSWRVGPYQAEARQYHSTALLLPDGRVLSTGDDLNPVLAPPWDRSTSSPHDTGEIYSPPYLFSATPRPVISSAPQAVKWNVPFGVGTSGDIDEAVLIAPAAVTHANDMNQRFVPLHTNSTQPGGISVQSPPSANVAPPGWYMLFLVNDGVPSVAKWVRLGGDAANVPALPPDVAAPKLRLRFAEDGWLRRLRRYGKLRVRVTVNEPATVAVKLVRGTRRVARARIKMTKKGTRTIDLKPRRSTLRWLRQARKPELRFSVIAVDAAKNDTTWTRLLKPALGRR